MQIIYLHQYFSTPSSANGTRSYEISKQLTESGHHVNMITGTNYSEEEIKGYLPNNFKLYSTNTPYSNALSFFRRILAFLIYVSKSLIIGMKIKQPDVVFASSTPLTIALPALAISKFKRTKFVFEVRDVWPEVPVKLGFIKNKLLISLLYKFEKYVYDKADHIIALSPGMKTSISSKGVNPEKISVVTNFSIMQLYETIPLNKREIKKRYGIPEDKFVCVHPGTMGFVNGLDYVIDAAKKIQKYDKDIIFLLVGDGKEKNLLKNRVKVEAIENVIFRDPLPKHEIALLTKGSDIGLVTVRNNPILFNNSANKFFDFLAAGIPVMINYSGWQQTVLETHNAGFASDPEDYQDMVEKILEIKNNRRLFEEMGDNAYHLAKSSYSRDICCKRIEEIIKGA